METTEHKRTEAEETQVKVDWKNPPDLRDLKQDFLDSQSSHDSQVSKIGTWLDNLNVEGAAKPKVREGRSSVQPRLIRKQAEWRYASLSEPFLASRDVFSVDPVTWEDREAALQNSILLNNQLNTKINKVVFIDDYVRTAVDEGTVFVKVGWEFEEEEVEVERPIVDYVVNPEMGPLHEELAQLKENSPSEYNLDVPEELKQAHELTLEHGQPIEAIVTGYGMVKEMQTKKNHPTLEVCDYRNLVVDPSCGGDLDKASFVIDSFEASKSMLEKEGKYHNLDKIMVETNSILGDPDHASENDTNFNFSDEPRKKFVVREYWGYWDTDGSGIVKPIVAAWVGDTMIRLEESPFPDGKLPFVKVQYLPVRRKIYGEPDGHLLEDNQRIIGAVTRGMIDLLGKSANGQTGTQKGALDVTNRRRFERGQDYEYNGNVTPDQAFHMHKYPEIPQSAHYMLNLQNQEAESMTGVKAYNDGVSSASLGDVAAGIRGALDAASKREMGILRRLAAGMVKIGHKIIAMNAEFLDEEEVVRVTNEQFVPVRRDDLFGKFDLHLSISTAEEDNAKAQELAFMLQTGGQSMDQAMIRLILVDIARLRKMPELAEKIQNFQPEPDPHQERLKELEIAIKEAELAKIQSETLGNYSDAGLKEAKSGTEQAKAGNLQSDTDKKTLDFVEQESGVKQERDLQKQGAQAMGNIELEKAKHALKADEDRRKLLDQYIQGEKVETTAES